MPDPIEVLAARLAPAFEEVGGGGRRVDPAVRPSEHADFQANGALALAKELRRNPREVASEVLALARLDELGVRAEVAGPGFLNLTLSDDFVVAQLETIRHDPRLGVPLEAAETVVVDYSAPNVAKEMHIGHLRSTIIGDALARVLGFLGDSVIRQNHVGDWGTPFGMLIEHLVDLGEDAASEELSLGDLNAFYQQARVKFDADADFRERSRRRVVALQAGDPTTLHLWQLLVEQSARYFDLVYRRLGVLLEPEDLAGESSYNDALTSVVSELDAKGILVESDGARCVFPPGFTNRDGEPLPLIVQKADGGFGYAATDLAALRHRVRDLGASRIVYVVGSPQREHFAMVFAVAELAGWLVPPVRAEHVSFGSVLGADGRTMRTRAGETIRLSDLLDEAVARADAVIAEKNPDLEAAARTLVAGEVGIGAVKYADLVNDRTRDYRFDWDRMLAFEGNTAPYLQYAHARIWSIFRRGGIDPAVLDGRLGELSSPAERALGLAVLGFDGAVRSTADKLQPHRLCSYLFDLAGAFTTFYETCPVLGVADEGTRLTRLVLCDLAARVLAQGLGMLGIAAPLQM